jgi:TrmH family RNA methyltransferase
VKVIRSMSNPVVKHLRSLSQKKYRHHAGTYIADGVLLVGEALSCGTADVQMLIVDAAKADKFPALTEACRERGIEILCVHEDVLRAVCDTKAPQGVAAVIGIPACDDAMPEGGLVLALEDVSDPGNVGTLIRTADAAGASMVLLSENCADVYAPKVVRSTMGSLYHLPVGCCRDIAKSVRQLKDGGFTVIAAHLDGETVGLNSQFPQNTVLLLGNEARGLSDELTALSDRKLKLPMAGKAESLNVSVAGSVLMYLWLFQR